MSEERRKEAAAGLPAVLRTMQRTLRETGAIRGARLLSRINQEGGFDCPGCAWPESGDRSFAEFCENGAKAVTHEATTARIDEDFFRRHGIDELRTKDDHWLESRGRLTRPMRKAPGSDRYEPVGWDEAFARIGDALAALESPHHAAFYTSGRTSNEAAFLYQLFVREFGTNNLPDCSNMCHESSGTGLGETIGVGKGTVGLDDFALADCILVLGQNPGTNHPRMLVTLQKAKERGATIVSINPLRELGLVRFSNPQRPLDLLGRATDLTDLHLQVRVGGDVALLQGIAKHVLEAEKAAPGTVLDHEFLARHTTGLEELKAALDEAPWEELEEESGIGREDMKRAADLYVRSRSVIACWAMGLTQHRHGVANVREITNLLLLRGNVGRPGAGLCPVRGHSNVQVSTKLNRSHLETGAEAFLLPCLGRTEVDVQASGPQFVTVEDSMSMVHRSEGKLPPASGWLRSEAAIVAGIARAALGASSRVPWEELVADYRRIREHISRVVPGFERFEERLGEPGGFRLPNAARERRFVTGEDGDRARFTRNARPRLRLADGEFLLMTVRSHDQFNTTVYGKDDRYRGISGERMVVFMNPDDARQAGFDADTRVDIVNLEGGQRREVRGMRVVPHDIPRRCLAAYFPEANALVALESFAEGSRTPAYKSIVVRLERAG